MLSTSICDNLKKQISKEKDKSSENIKNILRKNLQDIIDKNSTDDLAYDKNVISSENKEIILVVGVNGVGKTTSCAKLARLYKEQNKKVLLVAADTFRAGATEQLISWANKLNIDVHYSDKNSDPASVVYDALNIFVSKNYDVLICDTAGRLHNKKNLMAELGKINKIIDNKCNSLDINFLRQTYIVLDATTGQNATSQFNEFSKITNITGIILTKLDSTSKGGVVFNIVNNNNVAIKYIGVGEKETDFYNFNSKDFVDSII